MTTRHPHMESTAAAERGPKTATSRIAAGAVEPKFAIEDEWLARMETRSERELHHRAVDDPDFDIAAWFALDQDENARTRCMTECWYG